MRRYYAPIFSSAYGFRFTMGVCAVLVPFLISYTIEPFWLTESSYTTQPDVRFKHQMILMLEGNTPGSDLVWSTYDQLNEMLGTKFRVAEIQAREDDNNRDGKIDEFYIYARVPLHSGESIHHVRIISFFDYQLTGKVSLQMESAAYFDQSAVVSGSECEVWGDMRMRQRGVLRQSSGRRDIYNTTIIAETNGGIDSMEQVLFNTMLKDYLARNESTLFADAHPVWTAGSGSEFVLKMHIRVPPDQLIRYRPGVLETIRYGVLQFLAVYIFVAALVGAATHFMFENQVFETRVHDDSRPKTHIH